jgi:hypothetical protein
MIRFESIRKWSVAGAALAALALTSCNEQDYLYYRRPVPAKHSDVTHKLKQLQGNSVVDILWVIDNSGSMYQHQQNVISNTALFLNQFVRSGNILDWKMGLVSTDISDDPFIGFGAGREVTSRTPGNVGLFQGAVNRLGTGGNFQEEGFAPMLQALNRYPDFVRPNSTLAVIFVTDAQEQGDQSVQDIVAQMARIKSIRETVSYGIFWTQDLGCALNPGEEDWELQGSRYGEFIQATSGKAYALCSSDFGANLADLGKDLVSRITSPKLFLDSRPRVSTLRVVHQGAEVPAGVPGSGGRWYYDQGLNAIVFHDLSFAPGDDEEVQVIYDEDTGIDMN